MTNIDYSNVRDFWIRAAKVHKLANRVPSKFYLGFGQMLISFPFYSSVNLLANYNDLYNPVQMLTQTLRSKIFYGIIFSY